MSTIETTFTFCHFRCKDIFKLPFNAICALPEFDHKPNALFANQLVPTSKASTHKKYVEQDELYKFGALLAGINPEMRNNLPSIIAELETEVAKFKKEKENEAKEDKKNSNANDNKNEKDSNKDNASESDKMTDEERKAIQEERATKKKQLNQLQKRWKLLQKSYCESIPITNDGEFDLNLQFKWEFNGAGEYKSGNSKIITNLDQMQKTLLLFIMLNNRHRRLLRETLNHLKYGVFHRMKVYLRIF